MNPLIENVRLRTRRHFLQNCSMGLGALAFSNLVGTNSASASRSAPLASRQPHFAPRAKRVIYLHTAGSPPHLDLYDYKPALVQRDGEDCPDEYLKGKRFAFTSGVPKLMGTPHTFNYHGKSGLLLSDALPHLGTVADEIAVIRSLHTEQFNHAPAQLFLYTGSARQGRPSLGSWAVYGMGTENANLPGFVVLISGGHNPSAGKTAWGSGFLPSVYQGVQCRSKGDPVLYVSNPKGMDRKVRRLSLDTLRSLNEIQAEAVANPETQTRISQFELAFRMQVSVPEVMDLSREPQSMLDAYGAAPGELRFANNCLLARRLVEQGVRYVQLFDWGWDYHGTSPGTSLGAGLRNRCKTFDQPVTALIRDLKARGLLDETLIICSGEFGRTPFREGRTAKGQNLGRDHYPDCYSMWMAGGGIRGGQAYGSSDDLGFLPAENPVSIHDLQATILKLMGFDHERLTYRFQGRDFRLTDVHGKVVDGLLA